MAKPANLLTKTKVVIFSFTRLFLFSCKVILCTKFSKKYQPDGFDKDFHQWSKWQLDQVKLSYDIEGLDKLTLEPGTPYIVMSNHGSIFDIPLTVMAIPGSIRMLAKRELFKFPFFGWAMKSANFIAIDRSNPRQAVKDLKVARKRLESGIILWISPEGTRSRDGHLNPFKRGGFKLAMQTRAHVIPMALSGNHQVLPAKTRDLQTHTHVNIRIGQPIDSQQFKREGKEQALLEAVQAQITRLLEGKEEDSASLKPEQQKANAAEAVGS